MKVVEFEEMRLGDFFLKLRYFLKKREDEMLFIANLIRMQTLELLNVQIEPKHRIQSVRDLWCFPWENEDEKVEHVDLNSEAVKQELKNLYNVWGKD